MLFQPVDDIPDIDNVRMSIPKLDKMMISAVKGCNFAIKYRLNLKKKTKYGADVGRLVSDHLNLFVSTHRSLRSLLRRAFRQADYPLVSDAVSLGREQVEKVFNVALLLENPDKWLLVYLRSSLKSDFEEYLLRLEEYGNIPRLKDFLTIEYPKYIETIRCPPAKLRIGPKELVSRFGMRLLEYKWKNPGAAPPSWYNRKAGPSKYIKERFEFPTPGTAIQKFRNPTLKKFLTRWYKEYQYLCQFSHISLRKMIMPVMHESKNLGQLRTRGKLFKGKVRG